METLTNKINEILNPIVNYLSTQRHLQAIKWSIVKVLPAMIAAGFLLLLVKVCEFINIDLSFLLKSIHVLIYPILIFISFEIGSNLAEAKNLNSRNAGIFTVLACLISLRCEFGVLSLPYYFEILMISCLAGELYVRSSSTKFNSKTLPPTVTDTLNQAIPGVIVLSAACLLSISSVDYSLYHAFMLNITSALDSIFGVFLIIILTCGFWIFGVHGATVIGTVFRPFWFYMLLINLSCYTKGIALPYLTTECFYQWFLWIGGSGTTIGLYLAIKMIAKSEHLVSLGKGSFTSTLCNINENFIFGTPIAGNKHMMIPFVLAPIVSSCAIYYMISTGFIHAPMISAPWVLPAPLGAFIVCAGDLHAILGVIITIVISTLIYFPFVSKYDTILRNEA